MHLLKLRPGWPTMRSAIGLLCLAACLTCTTSVASAATGVDTVDWAPDGSVNGAGAGTLGGLNVTYTTVVGGNAGTTLFSNWNTIPGTNDAVGTGASNLNAGVLGVNGNSTQVNRVTFSGTVVDPVIYAAFGDPGTSLDFGGKTVTLLDSNGASLAGNVVTFTGPGFTVNTSFAARITGTFGPSRPLTFSYVNTTAKFHSVTFTVSVVFPPPNVVADTPSTAPGAPVTFNPLANDSGVNGATLVPGSVRLLNPGNANAPVTTLTIAGQGTYTVNTTTGAITFTPVVGFSGPTSPVTYRVTDSNGASNTATITTTVAAIVPVPLASPLLGGIAVALAGLFGVAFMRRRRNGIA